MASVTLCAYSALSLWMCQQVVLCPPANESQVKPQKSVLAVPFVCLQMWLEEDVELYDFAKVRPLIKKKQVKVQFLFEGRHGFH